MPLAAGGPASRIEKKRQEEFFSVTPRKERVLHAPFALQTGMVSCADAHDTVQPYVANLRDSVVDGFRGYTPKRVAGYCANVQH